MTHEPISPELALVDAELAARARAALPGRVADDAIDPPPPSAPIIPTPVVPSVVAATPMHADALALASPVYEPTATSGRGTPRLRRRTMTRVTTVIALSIALNVALVHELVSTSGATPVSSGPDTTDDVSRPGPTKARAGEPDQVVAPSRPGSRLRWRAVRGAVHYDLIIWSESGGRRILDLFPRVPTALVPTTIEGRKLPAGTYRWYVYPAFDSGGETRYGALAASGVIVATER